MASYVLTNNLSTNPLYTTGANQAWNNSWVEVDNSAARPLYARASYITNFEDLTISLNTDHVTIGDVNLADPNTGLNANVVPVGVGQGALRVLTQDLDSQHDSFTIGDKNAKFAYVTNSALNVFTVNGISAVSITNQLSAVSITNQLTGITVLNPVTAVSITNQLTSITILNPVSSFSLTNSAINVNIVSETKPTFFQFNNFGTYTHRGWTMSDTQIPMLAVRVKPNQNITARIAEYELGNNNANQSTIGYVWYENPAVTGLSGNWIDLNSQLQYAIFTDAYGSNTPNGISGGTTRHSGIVIGKNSSSEVELSEIALNGGASPNVLVLAVQRLDSATKLDVWFAVTLAV